MVLESLLLELIDTPCHQGIDLLRTSTLWDPHTRRSCWIVERIPVKLESSSSFVGAWTLRIRCKQLVYKLINSRIPVVLFNSLGRVRRMSRAYYRVERIVSQKATNKNPYDITNWQFRREKMGRGQSNLQIGWRLAEALHHLESQRSWRFVLYVWTANCSKIPLQFHISSQKFRAS